MACSVPAAKCVSRAVTACAIRSQLCSPPDARPRGWPVGQRFREPRLCPAGCVLAVTTGRLLACNHSVRHRDKESDSRGGSDREKAGEGRADREDRELSAGAVRSHRSHLLSRAWHVPGGSCLSAPHLSSEPHTPPAPGLGCHSTKPWVFMSTN